MRGSQRLERDRHLGLTDGVNGDGEAGAPSVGDGRANVRGVAGRLVEHDLDRAQAQARTGRAGGQDARPVVGAGEHKQAEREGAARGQAVEQLPLLHTVGGRSVLDRRHAPGQELLAGLAHVAGQLVLGRTVETTAKQLGGVVQAAGGLAGGGVPLHLARRGGKQPKLAEGGGVQHVEVQAAMLEAHGVAGHGGVQVVAVGVAAEARLVVAPRAQPGAGRQSARSLGQRGA